MLMQYCKSIIFWLLPSFDLKTDVLSRSEIKYLIYDLLLEFKSA